MSTTPDNPAFPTIFQDHGELCAIMGLTKREHFAAMALQGLLASGPHDCAPKELAHDAVLQADALIETLNK